MLMTAARISTIIYWVANVLAAVFFAAAIFVIAVADPPIYSAAMGSIGTGLLIFAAGRISLLLWAKQ